MKKGYKSRVKLLATKGSNNVLSSTITNGALTKNSVPPLLQHYKPRERVSPSGIVPPTYLIYDV